ncbi:CinA family protein [Spiroplasma turonicum]|uniref:Competence damage-inducible protein A n=1 Tax=Spiroplasma turonicum TaxID=216946 RepID=A0A0K1P6Z5_9MOLU|nr:nicotinamide-nucleotide amidohydrolase family protein [Spiroplasma turonicum]AKU80081.1 competence damage-inducible protein A [Spiroplasma turonicum]ALX71083.1 competence damage-inducible protein A [Spiroplasma turonicum]
MKKLIKFLRENNLTVSSCESFTGGLFANLFTNYKNSSVLFKGAFCCYSDDFKVDVLNIDKNIIKKYSAVSVETIEDMLKNTQKLLNTDIVFAFTGYAPPSNVDNDLKGLSYIGYRYKDKNFILKFVNKSKISRKKYKILAINKIINEFLNNLKNN